MKIEHIAIWCNDIELMKEFYLRFFDLRSNEKYYNQSKQFSSYFLSFENGARIELMHRPEVSVANGTAVSGLTHIAVSVGSRDRVDTLTEEVRRAGYNILGEPRTTGDGYYESVIADPEGNQIEITI